MSLHGRYLQQAAWTREIRSYLFRQAQLPSARRILEVGCGTGAVLRDQSTFEPGSRVRHPLLHGVDSSAESLTECRVNASSAILTRADALALPYPDRVFDITYCHFLLLWVKHPLSALREMKRVTRGHVLALAEPDYASRVDRPAELARMGQLQTAALRLQGADVSLGSRLADLFYQAGIHIREAGVINTWSQAGLPAPDLEAEWTVLQQDLAGTLSQADLEKYRLLDKRAREAGERILHVPTYFAWGQV